MKKVFPILQPGFANKVARAYSLRKNQQQLMSMLRLMMTFFLQDDGRSRCAALHDADLRARYGL